MPSKPRNIPQRKVPRIPQLKQPEINMWMQTISEAIRHKRGIFVGSEFKVVKKKDGTTVSYRPRKRKLGRGDLKQLATAAKAKGVSLEQLKRIILSCESIEEVFERLSRLPI